MALASSSKQSGVSSSSWSRSTRYSPLASAAAALLARLMLTFLER